MGDDLESASKNTSEPVLKFLKILKFQKSLASELVRAYNNIAAAWNNATLSLL